MHLRAAPLWGLSALCMAPALAAAVSLSETDWAVRSLETRDWSSDGTSSSFQRLANGGQPGAALVYNAVLRAPAQSTATTSAIVIATDLVHAPTRDGRIGSLGFSQSLNLGTTDVDRVRATAAFLLAQEVGGVQAVYLHALPAALAFDRWLTVSASGLVAADFLRLDLLTGQLLPGQHPVFDAALPTTFGIGLGGVLDNGGSNFLRERLQVRIDNLVVTVSPVPEPSTVWMGLAGLALLMAALRRSAQAGAAPGL